MAKYSDLYGSLNYHEMLWGRAEHLSEMEKTHPNRFDYDGNEHADGLEADYFSSYYRAARLDEIEDDDDDDDEAEPEEEPEPEEPVQEEPEQTQQEEAPKQDRWEQFRKQQDYGNKYEEHNPEWHLGGSLQEAIVATIFSDSSEDARAIVNELDPKWFEFPYREMVVHTLEYWRQWDRAPETAHIGNVLGYVLDNPKHQLYNRYMRIARRINDMVLHGINPAYVRSQVNRFAGRQILKLAIFEAGTLISQTDSEADYLKCDQIFTKAIEARHQLASEQDLAISGKEWLMREYPPYQPLLGDFITNDGKTMIVGPSGIGKTITTLEMAARIAAGQDFLHWTGSGAPKRVLYVDGEMSKRQMQERLREIFYRIPEAADTLFVLCADELDSGIPDLSTPEGQQFIDAWIKKIGGVDLIVLDHAECLMSTDDKYGVTIWAKVQPWIQAKSREQIGQIWVEQTGNDESRAYGTVKKRQMFDTIALLKRSKDELPPGKIEFELTCTKHRSGNADNYEDFQSAIIRYNKNEGWTSSAVTSQTKASGDPLTPEPKAEKFYDMLVEEMSDSGEEMMDGSIRTTIAKWRDRCYRRGLLTHDDDPKVQKSQATQFNKYRRQLVEAGWIRCDHEDVWLLEPAEVGFGERVG